MKVKCQNCGHEWDYKGKSEYYVTCPKCLYKVNLKKEVKKDGRGKETEV